MEVARSLDAVPTEPRHSDSWIAPRRHAEPERIPAGLARMDGCRTVSAYTKAIPRGLDTDLLGVGASSVGDVDPTSHRVTQAPPAICRGFPLFARLHGEVNL